MCLAIVFVLSGNICLFVLMVSLFLLPPFLIVTYSCKEWNMGAVTWSSKNSSQHLTKFFGASWLTSRTGHCTVPNNWSLSALFFLTVQGCTLTDTACWGLTRVCTARSQLLQSALHSTVLPCYLTQNKQQTSETRPCGILFHQLALPKRVNSAVGPLN